MANRPQRRAQGVLFALLALFFAGIAFSAAFAGREGDAPAVVWAVALAAGVLALWMLTLAAGAVRLRRRT